MTEEVFACKIDKAIGRSMNLLIDKGKEYSTSHDRLGNFKQTGAMELKEPTETLFSMADKHIAVVAVMVKNPTKYSREEWNSHLDDIRNYTLLLDTLLIDLGVE